MWFSFDLRHFITGMGENRQFLSKCLCFGARYAYLYGLHLYKPFTNVSIILVYFIVKNGLKGLYYSGCEVGSMLELMDVRKYYKNNKAVNGITFQLHQGEVLGLLGANGAGKSTTLSMIATLIKPDSGQIYFKGQDIVLNPAFMRECLGYVPQEIALYPSISGRDNLEFWGRANYVRGRQLKQRIEEIKNIINLSEEVLDRKVSSYSGGMKRRLNIGAALLHNPELVIMDEPTVGLDVEARNQVLEAVQHLKGQGASVIYAGHYMEEMERVCDKICILVNGKGILFGELEKLLAGYRSLEDLYVETVGVNHTEQCD